MDKPSPLDQSIADIAAGDASDQTLDQFQKYATSDPAAWQRLALTLRDELAMRSQLDVHLRDRQIAADEIARARRAAPASAKPRAVITWSSWSGWAVAAALLLTLLISFTTQPSRTAPPQSDTALASFTAQEALDRYVKRGTEEGRVIAELPTVMVEARELDNGKLEVLYLRQFLEREQVNEVYTVAPDELGEPQPVKVDFTGWDNLDTTL